ncbi:hypothetical protein CC1G_10092 [Coprinopsis cinerea okayama7|uniref:F-box domain-containing protein n=1 Tax=Coprinopsis cinerea (strain Okayama-7 / 130 / ATCC MYA-4618 / FGSC 9003) TaxID=240176 RepID=A8NDV5_COPC7|nr:hypothetical protein CC1G_10092 [Coprinopsis cinerea okayama7\|eukprot:XP_001832873.1 hypothetical protein CC1G_10092 [Coprinopsis cinerea okayama7\
MDGYLPPEILCQILAYAVAPRNKDGTQITAADPFELAQYRCVSKHWDQTALSTTTLWTSLRLDFGSLRPASLPHGLVSFTDNWFRRAGPSKPPLLLEVIDDRRREHTFSAHSAKFQREVVEEITAILLNPNRNWYEWRFDSDVVQRCFLGLEQRGFREMLRNLILKPNTNLPLLSLVSTYMGKPTLPTVSEEARRPFYADLVEDVFPLTRLSIANSFGRWFYVYVPIPRSLRYLRLSGGISFPINRVLTLPALEELVVEGNTSDMMGLDFKFEEHIRTTQPIPNRSIQRLVFIGEGGTSFASAFLNRGTFPSLQLFRLCGDTKISIWLPDIVRRFCLRSFGEGRPPHSFCLSLEGSKSSSKDHEKLLAEFYGRISHLHLRDPDVLLEGDHDMLRDLGQSLEAVVCAQPSISDHFNSELDDELLAYRTAVWRKALDSLCWFRGPRKGKISFHIPDTKENVAIAAGLVVCDGVEVRCASSYELKVILESGGL